MASWCPGISTTCVLCRNSSETRNHLFFSCDYVARVWSTLSTGLLGDNYTADWLPLINLLTSNSMDSKLLLLSRLVFQSSVYHIWQERNRRRHGEVPKPDNHLTCMIDKSIRNRISSLRSPGNHMLNTTI